MPVDFFKRTQLLGCRIYTTPQQESLRIMLRKKPWAGVGVELVGVDALIGPQSYHRPAIVLLVFLTERGANRWGQRRAKDRLTAAPEPQ